MYLKRLDLVGFKSFGSHTSTEFSPGIVVGTVPYVDIRPGMRLRIETQTSQFLTPSSPLNGYVSSGRFEFFINSVPASNGTRVVTSW